ncbi:MAG: hypothetical protein IT529_06505 [Burkholderiales bacterium]|nr:hypothetical protein [Burkholderiales bacterium]
MTGGTDTERRAEPGNLDLEAVARLIDALENDLGRLPADSAEVRRIKDEVETLRNLLGSPVRRHHWVRDALHDIRAGIDDAVDTVVTEGLEASRYIAEIGRILGL